MAKLDLPPAKILHVAGWGKATPTRGWYIVDFAHEGEGSVVIGQARNGKMAYRFAPPFLSLTVKNAAIRSGGGFVGGGFGAEGAAVGMVGGALLNALTARNRHYGMLIFSLTQAGVSPRVVILGYQNVTDAEIAKRAAVVLVPFVDYWIDGLMQRLDAVDDATRIATRPVIELMAKRGWFTAAQLSGIEPGLQPRSAEVEGAFVDQVARPALLAADDTVAQLQKLADLHASGALTDEEFVAAKARLLG